jgi:hypothetical protein
MTPHPWTPAGLELLRKIYDLIERTGSYEALAHHIVKENHEIFRKHSEIKKADSYFRNSKRYNNPGRRGYHWIKHEIDILAANIDLPTEQLCKLLPNRKWHAISNMRYAIRKGKIKKAITDAPICFEGVSGISMSA